jgi:hypothetical protein
MNTALRRMSTGQVLDRTFNLYRRNFVLFFGIALLPPALLMLMQLAPLGALPLNRVGAAWAAGAAIAGVIGMLVFFIAWIIGYAIAQAATVFAVSAVHLGRQTSVSESYSRVRGRYGRVLNVVLSIIIRAVGGTILLFMTAALVIPALVKVMPRGSAAAGLLGGLVMIVAMVGAVSIALYYFLRYGVAVPACVLEDIKARAALKRSVYLTKGDRGRIFVIYFLVGVLNYILMMALVLLAVFLGAALAGQQSVIVHILNVVASFLAGALTGPIATIAMSLVYYDERVRKEAFDLHLMMNALDKPVAGAASAIAT